MPKTFKLGAELWVSLSLRETFAFFEDPGNLAKITPPWLNFQMVSPEKVEMRAGAEIDYVIRWLGMPLRWRTLIREYQPPVFFSDEQIRGPYRLWLHQHTLQSEDGGTRVSDLVRYSLPLDPFSRVAHPLVRKQLLQIFGFRQSRIGGLLKVPTREIVPPTITPE
jgi:ligand-binding SRPBCC domain-containing protein